MPSATTSNVKVNREDLTDVYSQLNPEETPLQTLASMGPKAEAMYTETVVDDLGEPSLAGVPEGQDVQSYTNQQANMEKIGNRQHKLRDTAFVSAEQEASSTAAVKGSDIAFQESKAMKRLKIAFERVMCGDQAMSSANPQVMGGLGYFIDDTGPSHVPEYARTRTGAITTEDPAGAGFGPSTILDVTQAVYVGTGNARQNYVLLGGPDLKSAFSAHALDSTETTGSAYRWNQDGSSETNNYNVTRMTGPFGTIDFIETMQNAWVDGATAASSATQKRGYLINPDLLEVRPLIPINLSDRKNDGAGERSWVEGMMTLLVKNPKGFGKFSAS